MGNRLSVNSTQQTLATAISTDNLEAVRDLLALKPDIVKSNLKNRDGKHTFLELATAHGNMQTFELLYRATERIYGAWKMAQMVNSVSEQGQTLLMLACRAGCSPCVQHLLAAGGDVMLVEATSGRTALHYAVLSSSVSCIEAVLGAEGAAVQGALVVDMWGHCRFPDMRNVQGLTALHLAACQGDCASVSALLRGGAKLDAVCRTLISAQASHPDLDLLRLRNRQGLRASQCAQLSQQPRLALILSPQTSTAHYVRLEQFARLIMHSDEEPVLPERGVAFRVKLLLKLKEMRKTQMIQASAEKQEAAKNVAPDDDASDATKAADTADASAAAETADAAGTSASTSASHPSDGGSDARGECQARPVTEDSQAARASTSAEASLSTASGVPAPPSAPSAAAAPAASNASAWSSNLRLDLDAICYAMAARDASMPALMSSWLRTSGADPDNLPDDWQLQIASIALTCASSMASTFPSMYYGYSSHNSQTSDLLLALGGKIMKSSLWPEGASRQNSTMDAADAGKSTVESTDDDCAQCAICMRDESVEDVQLHPCSHRLCMQCMFEITYTNCAADLSCPFCRESIQDVTLSGAEAQGDDEAADGGSGRGKAVCGAAGTSAWRLAATVGSEQPFWGQ
eukprot:jgi/Tetstr1/429311/TSEL_019229.t1